MSAEGGLRPGFKAEVFKRLGRLGIFSRVPPEKSRTEISLPQEEVGGLMHGMDMLKLRSRFLPEEEDGRVNYRLSVRKKELLGLSGVFREFMMMGVGGRVKIDFSYDQRDFGVVRRAVSLEHRGRKVELVVQPSEPICELNLEYPAGFGIPMSEEDRRVLADDLLIIIKAGLSNFSGGGPGSS